MLFIFSLVFSLGILAIPIAIDINRYGPDNILRKSGREILNYLPIQHFRNRYYFPLRFARALVGLAVITFVGMYAINNQELIKSKYEVFASKIKDFKFPIGILIKP